MTATGSRKGQADQKSPEGSLQRSSAGFSYGQPGAGQGVGPFPKPQPSFLYTYTNTQSPPQPQTQPMAPGNQVAQTQSKYRHSSASGDLEPGDPGQGYTEPGSKTAFGVTIGKLYNLKVHRSKGSSSPSQSKRSLDPSVRKSTG
ncbi:hypothetical protein NHX12_032604 [Muraenolepis orangiensis]|uniref:Uncharacterized protein n=1 Tax=Muraenolepis orangiensis TaxID=630683 RepID=A0A9Q0E9A1_9TELE|nr:hypothetical protein NHX12_032604 [Muraenolepis orangiensis]